MQRKSSAHDDNFEFVLFSSSFSYLQKSLGNEVHRLRKKVDDLKKQNSKSEPITDNDQYVFTKNK